MRELKFRAWNGTQIVYDVVCGAGIWGVKDQFYNIVDIDKNPMPQIRLMQYTGLTDKNGKEIYEGDIIRFDKKEMGVDKYIIQYAVDEVGMPKFWARAQKLKAREIWGGGDYEVIGNIWENPELLNSHP